MSAPTAPRNRTRPGCKIYRQCKCERYHRSIRRMAHCIWSRNVSWIVGSGPFACVAYCRTTTVTLCDTLEEAKSTKALIDNDACGGACRNRHDIVFIELPTRPTR